MQRRKRYSACSAQLLSGARTSPFRSRCIGYHSMQHRWSRIQHGRWSCCDRPSVHSSTRSPYPYLPDVDAVATRINKRQMKNFERITVDPGQMGGVPCVRHMRIPVATVLRLRAGGLTEGEILSEYPDL